MTFSSTGHILLRALWNLDRHRHIGTLDRRTKQFTNIAVDGVADAVLLAQSLCKQGLEVYLAPAGYLTPNCRKANNASGANSYWLDIDCGEAKAAALKGYATTQNAEKALADFCDVVKLPLPTHIVSSGNGLHAYWVLDAEVEREVWLTYAKKLKALTKAHGLLADDTRTADIASVMRIPDTLNYKYNPPVPVALLRASTALIERSTMFSAIAEAHSQLGTIMGPPSRCLTTAKLPENGAPRTGHLRLLEGIVRHIDADCGYDGWIHVGMALHHETGGHEDGLALFDAWSSTGETYKGLNETELKWHSFRSDHENPCTIRTLIWMAQREGYSMETICAELEPFETDGAQDGTS